MLKIFNFALTLFLLTPFQNAEALGAQNLKVNLKCGYQSHNGPRWIQVEADTNEGYSWRLVGYSSPSKAQPVDIIKSITKENHVLMQVQTLKADFLMIIDITPDVVVEGKGGNLFAKGVLLLPGQVEPMDTACQIRTYRVQKM